MFISTGRVKPDISLLESFCVWLREGNTRQSVSDAKSN